LSTDIAEPFGIVAGSVGIAAAFSACVDCFGYIQLGRHFGRDYQTKLLTLDLLRLRLSRWGEAVSIYEDPQLGNPNASLTELQAAKDTLVHLLFLFADSEKVSTKFKLSAKAGDLSQFASTDLGPRELVVHNRMRELALKRQKKGSILKLASWALYHGEEFTKLVDDISKLLDGLEKIFPAAARQQTLVRQAIAIAAPEEQNLHILENISDGVDKLLQTTTRVEIENGQKGHVYKNVVTFEKGKVLNGNSWSDAALGQDLAAVPSFLHVFEGIRTEGEAKVQNGEKFGGKDFWD
jgi:Prion-inhibition and propagation